VCDSGLVLHVYKCLQVNKKLSLKSISVTKPESSFRLVTRSRTILLESDPKLSLESGADPVA